MRTFSGIGAEELLAVIPGSQLEAVAQAVEHTVAVNEAVMSYYQQELGA